MTWYSGTSTGRRIVKSKRRSVKISTSEDFSSKNQTWSHHPQKQSGCRTIFPTTTSSATKKPSYIQWHNTMNQLGKKSSISFLFRSTSKKASMIKSILTSWRDSTRGRNKPNKMGSIMYGSSSLGSLQTEAMESLSVSLFKRLRISWKEEANMMMALQRPLSSKNTSKNRFCTKEESSISGTICLQQWSTANSKDIGSNEVT